MSKLRRWTRRALRSSQLASKWQDATKGIVGELDESRGNEESLATRLLKPSDDHTAFQRPKAWTPATETSPSRRKRKLIGRARVHVLVLGATGVGKQSLYRKLMYDNDMVDGRRHTMDLYDPTLMEPEDPKYNYGGYQYHLDILVSTPVDVRNGRESSHNSCGIILAYDLSNLDSWNEAVRLLKLISESCVAPDESDQPQAYPVVMMLGLKADMHGDGWPPLAQREQFAHQHGALFAECSARTGGGVHEAMEAFVKGAHQAIMRDSPSYERGTKLEVQVAFDKAVLAIQRAHPKPGPRPDVCRKWRWLELVEDGKKARVELEHRGGTVCVAVWGAPGIGKTSLVNKLLYDDMKGREGRQMREDISAGYVCDAYCYDVGVIEHACDRYVSDYQGVVLAYNVHEPETWEELQQFAMRIRQSHWRGGRLPVPFMVLGLQVDNDGVPETGGCRVVSEEVKEFALAYGCHFAECSAKTGDGVNEAFGSFVQEAHMQRMSFRQDARGLEDSQVLSRRAFSQIVRWSDSPDQGLPFRFVPEKDGQALERGEKTS